MGEREEETLALLKLSLCEDVGRAAVFALVGHFGSAQAALAAAGRELKSVEGISASALKGLREGPPPGAVEKELELLKRHGVRLVPFFSEDYPPPLKELESDRPPLLRIRGEYLQRDQLAVALVGTRRCSYYGRKQAARLAGELAALGFTIVSGLARGIDAEAHRGALRVGGRSIGVMGCGLASVYPPDCAELACQIAANGAVLSELPMSTPARAANFPPRNRLISALSLGVVVVEAPRRSGALITARLAGEQGRAVMAMPGNVGSPSNRGCHALIRDGAILVENAQDVVESLGPLVEPVRLPEIAEEVESARIAAEAPAIYLNERERQVLEMLGQEPRQIDSLIEQSGLPASIVSSTLLALEVKGMARRLPGGLYVRS